MAEQPENAEKKIVIDEDWKSQVQAERERQKHAEEQPPLDEPTIVPPESDRPLPKPDLSFLVSTLALQASAALGHIEDPMTRKAEVRLNRARHFIDAIEMLFEKTVGNRTEPETKAFEHLLHDLRMAYVATAQWAEKRRP